MALGSVAGFCLKFGHVTFILPFVLLGMIFHRRDLYAKATCFLFFVMIFNTLLKYMFKVQLLPHLGQGYAFPSGHMHAAVVFFGYIVCRSERKAVKVALVLLICCLGFSLVHQRFHDWFDVLGALTFAGAELLIYRYILVNFGEKATAVVALAASLASMVALSVIYKLEFHVWLAFYGLLGTILSLSFIEDAKLPDWLQKFVTLALSTSLIAVVFFVFKALAFKQFFLSEIRAALAPAIVMASINLCSRLRLRATK
ncbi:MAG: hypothetical protein LBB63_02760 [Holosporaceae bacterium]|jgi:undecaprenyl-diphosphatase|nr:hypothetical protein [Holosporaceae bacterium]